jgi:cytoskeletal protein RodZ
MALSQDEQRMLAEIERRLAADDPGLASCLTTFRRPGPGTVLRSPRARIIGSLFTVLLVAMVSLMVYAMVPFRGTHGLRNAPPQTSSAPTNAAISAVTSSEPNGTQQSSAGVSISAKSTTSQSAQTRSAAATATGKAQQAKVKPTNLPLLPETGP